MSTVAVYDHCLDELDFVDLYMHEHKPDIIVGCESHLDDSYTSSETFPVGYNIYRKDRAVGGGGVFLGIKDTLVSVEEPSAARAISLHQLG